MYPEIFEDGSYYVYLISLNEVAVYSLELGDCFALWITGFKNATIFDFFHLRWYRRLD